MKKTLLLLLMALSGFASKAQTTAPSQTQITFTTSSDPVYVNDGVVTFTAQGENNTLAVDMDEAVTCTITAIMITPNNQGYASSFYLSNITRGTHYTGGPNGTKSTFTANVNSSGFGADATVKFLINVTFVNIQGLAYSSGTAATTINIKPGSAPPVIRYNTIQSIPFNRNDCGTGYRGSTVYTTVQANQYTGASVQEANQKAINYINAHGQANANAIGTCDLLYPNPYMSQPFTKNNCGTGFTGSSVTYEVPANKYYSINSPAGAIAQAQNEINLNGQNNANSLGTCTPLITYAAGPNAANGGSQIDYTLPNLPSNYTVTWSVDGPATVASGGNTTTASIYFTPMPGGSNNGLVTVRITISDGVNPPTTTIVKKIIVTYCTVCP